LLLFSGIIFIDELFLLSFGVPEPSYIYYLLNVLICCLPIPLLLLLIDDSASCRSSLDFSVNEPSLVNILSKGLALSS